jgi:putative transposase
LIISVQMQKKKGIYLDCVNGYVDHIYGLVSLSNNQTISKLTQLIKGESSKWVNQHKLCDPAVECQDEYFAASVSHSQVQKVRNYIYNHERHHQKKTFQQEWEELIERYGLEEIQNRRGEKTI